MKKNYLFIGLSLLFLPISSCGSGDNIEGSTSVENNPSEIVNGRIDIISPEDASTISIANEEVTEFCKNYNKGDGAKYATRKDHFFMKGLLMEWQSNFECNNYEIVMSINEDLSDASKYQTDITSYLFDDLYVNQTYYYQISAYVNEQVITSPLLEFTTANTARTIEIGGVSNSRDLGGKMTDEGIYTAQGWIYRSANLDTITSFGRKKMLNELGIKTEIDLRYDYASLSLPKEGSVGYNVLGSSNYVTISGEEGLLGGARYAGTEQGLGIDGALGKEMLKQELSVFGNKENYPINFHCQIGRDRTGCLAMIINALLGVSEKDIAMDYEMSAFSSSGSGDGANFKTLVNTNLNPSLEYIKKFTGATLKDKCVNFLLDAGVEQSTIDTIRDVMLGDNR